MKKNRKERDLKKQLKKRYVFLEETCNKFNEEIRKKRPNSKVLDNLFQKIYFFATKDHLTGVFNRFCLNEVLSRELERAKRHGSHLTVIMLDIDNFKKYNDGFGHLQGDEALKKITTVIKEKIRKEDFVARYGGEEFIIVLPETNIKKSLEVAERIRASINRAKIKKVTKQAKKAKKIKQKGKGKKEKISPEKVSVSMGISQLRRKGIRDMLNRADSALYRAKSEGKNKICFSKNVPK